MIGDWLPRLITGERFPGERTLLRFRAWKTGLDAGRVQRAAYERAQEELRRRAQAVLEAPQK